MTERCSSITLPVLSTDTVRLRMRLPLPLPVPVPVPVPPRAWSAKLMPPESCGDEAA